MIVNPVLCFTIAFSCLQIVVIADDDIVNRVSGIAQYYKIWSSRNCDGDLIAYMATSGNITIPNQFYRSVTINGLWSYRICSSTMVCSRPVIVNDFDGKSCESLPTSSGNYIYSLKRYGDPHQIENSLHLFPEANLTGNEVVVKESSNIPRMTVGSYFFTGQSSWTFYGDPNFTGETHCRRPIDAVISAGYGFTYLPYASLSVGSVSQGCVDLQPPTTTTPLPADGNCTRPGSYYVPYGGDCRKFMICSRGQLLPEVMTCPEGTLFDEDFGDCNLESSVECRPSCPTTGTITFPHQRNCSLYWLCIFGDRILRQCAPGLVFDATTGLCDLEELVFCPNICPLQGSINLPHSGDCQLYWACESGRATLRRCQPTFLFDPSKGQCYPDDLVECGT